MDNNEKNDIKEENIFQKKVLMFLRYFFYVIIFIALDLIMIFHFGLGNANLIVILTIDIGLGLFITSLFSLNNEILRMLFMAIINIIILLYITFEVIEISADKSFKTIYPFKTIVLNAIEVIRDYSDELINIALKNIPMIVLAILFTALLIVVSFYIYIDKNYIENRKSFWILISASIIFLVVGALNINKERYSFDYDMRRDGLKVAVLNDLRSKSNKMILEDIEKDEVKYEKSEEDGYNVLDFDFENLIENEENESFNEINKFISSRTPTKKNEYTGLFRGKNLIMICAEGWNSIVVNEYLFPAMYRLINNGFKFTNFYQPNAASSTSCGEYAFMTGMIPVKYDHSFFNSVGNNMGFTVSKKLKEEGYTTLSFHNGYANYYNRDETHESHMGFDNFYANDKGLYDITHNRFNDDFTTMKILYDEVPKDKPFMAYMMTYNAHMPYVHNNEVSELYDNLYKEIDKYYGDEYSEHVKFYIGKNLLLERGLEYILEKLEEDGLLDDTVIVLAPDHYPYGLNNVKQLVGDDFDYLYDLYRDDEVNENVTFRDKTDLIFWSGCLENENKNLVKVIDKPVGVIDVTPTLLNLFGIDFDSRLYPGRDIFASDEGLVIYHDGKYISNDYIHDVLSKPVEDEAENEIKNEVQNLINYCDFNLANDYYGYLMNDSHGKQKYCYLTFDGGPTEITKEILDVLDEEDVKATFFVVGAKDISQIRTIIDRGHNVAPLAEQVDYFNVYNTDEIFINNITAISNSVRSMTGKPLRIMRFPGGSGNVYTKDINPGIMTRAIDYVKSIGLIYIDWNVDSGDLFDISSDEIYANVIKGATGKTNICVLLHDDVQNEETVKALPQIIKRLKELGYKFKYLDAYTHIFQQKCEN